MSMIGNFMAISPEQLQQLLEAPDQIEALIYEDDDYQGIDIDKAWHGIHFLLTASVWEGEPPLAWAILGGTEIGPDVGYGPARYLLSEQVREVAQALRELPRATVETRFDPAQMEEAEIYPGIWDEGKDALEYLMSYYDEVVQYYQQAAEKGQAMLRYIN
jgi:hypothetical protein